MEYSVHGRIIEWPELDELGYCFNLDKGPVEARYITSYAKRIIDVANKISIERALSQAKEVAKKSSEQLNHTTLDHLPRFKEGLENAVKFYNLLAKTLAESPNA